MHLFSRLDFNSGKVETKTLNTVIVGLLAKE